MQDLRSEIWRKLVHLSSVWMIFAIYFLDKKTCFAIFAFLLTGLLAFEAFRGRHIAWMAKAEKILALILRPHETEQNKFTGATYMLAGALLLLLFDKIIGVTALSILIVSDTAASLVGKKWGKTKIWGKSLEGSAAFLCSAFLIVAVIGFFLSDDPAEYFMPATSAAVLATFAELSCKKMGLDDNLCIPLVVAVTMLFFGGF